MWSHDFKLTYVNTLALLQMKPAWCTVYFLSVFRQYYLHPLHVSDLSRSINRRNYYIFCDTWHLCSV